jgi:GTPase SAR1 family protein
LNVDAKGAIYLLGCKSDLPLEVSEVEVMAFAEKERLAYFKCSAKENIGVRESFKIIVEEVASEILKKPEAVAKVKI